MIGGLSEERPRRKFQPLSLSRTPIVRDSFQIERANRSEIGMVELVYRPVICFLVGGGGADGWEFATLIGCAWRSHFSRLAACSTLDAGGTLKESFLGLKKSPVSSSKRHIATAVGMVECLTR